MQQAKGLKVTVEGTRNTHNAVIVVLVFLVLASDAALPVSGSRAILTHSKGKDYKSLMESMLPRGPVPPSGPSPCHNRLSSFRYNKLSIPDDYIICP